MIYFHGLRCSEVIKIRLTDLDLEKNKIYIEATKKGKFGNEFLNPLEKDLILDYLEICPEDKTDFLFISNDGGQIGRQHITGSSGVPKTQIKQNYRNIFSNFGGKKIGITKIGIFKFVTINNQIIGNMVILLTLMWVNNSLK